MMFEQSVIMCVCMSVCLTVSVCLCVLCLSVTCVCLSAEGLEAALEGFGLLPAGPVASEALA